MSIDFATEKVGYQPETSLQNGLASTVAWLRKEKLVSRWLQSDIQKAA